MAIIKGTSNADEIFGSNSSDTIFGYSGHDRIFAGDGNDSVTGGADNDEIEGGAGSDSLYGNSGNDSLYGETGNDLLYGHDGDDYLVDDILLSNPSAVFGDDTIFGGSGNDEIQTSGGHDLAYGNEGDDHLNAKNYNYANATTSATLYGGDGDDDITIGTLSDDEAARWDVRGVLSGDNGNDYLRGGVLADVISGGTGNDFIDISQGADTISGGSGNDTFGIVTDYVGWGGSGFSIIDYDHEHDKIVFDFSDQLEGLYDLPSDIDIKIEKLNDGRYHATIGSIDFYTSEAVDKNSFYVGYYNPLKLIPGTSGNDSIKGGGAAELFLGQAGKDTIKGGDGGDQIYGGNGSDKLYGDSGNDTINDDIPYWQTDNARDTIYGGSGNDEITANGGSDLVYGDSGDDRISDSYYSSGDDTYHGGDGNDTLASNAGLDRLFGGQGADVFDISGGSHAIIKDFEHGVDRLLITIWDVKSLADITIKDTGDDFLITSTKAPELAVHLNGNLTAADIDFYFAFPV